MNKTIKIYIGVFILLVTGIFLLEINKPTPIDWSPTFNEKHTKPYGLKVLHEELPLLFNGRDLIDINLTPFEYFDEEFNFSDSTYYIQGNYLYIHDGNLIDEVSAERILDFAAHGNNVFISSTMFPEVIEDSLNFKIKYTYTFNKKGKLYLSNPLFVNDTITLDKNVENIYFNELDSLHTTVLGYQSFKKNTNLLSAGEQPDTEEHINYVKIKYREGAFFLHTQPYVFTNYHLLKDRDYTYAEKVFSYLPDNTILFDSVNKAGKDLGSSPFRFILSKPALRWAWYILLLLLVTFLIFNAKRKQRIIKIIKPLPNTTVDFTKTIANLYFETQDHSNLIDKKVTYFLEKIRSDYYLDTQNLDDSFARNLALKAGKNKEDVVKLVKYIRYLTTRTSHSESQLLELNKQIEEFYNTKNYGTS